MEKSHPREGRRTRFPNSGVASWHSQSMHLFTISSPRNTSRDKHGHKPSGWRECKTQDLPARWLARCWKRVCRKTSGSFHVGRVSREESAPQRAAHKKRRKKMSKEAAFECASLGSSFQPAIYGVKQCTSAVPINYISFSLLYIRTSPCTVTHQDVNGRASALRELELSMVRISAAWWVNGSTSEATDFVSACWKKIICHNWNVQMTNFCQDSHVLFYCSVVEVFSLIIFSDRAC